MAQWAGVTAELAKTTKLPADMMTWFQARECEDYNDIAMACSSADATEPKFVNPMKTAKLRSTRVDPSKGQRP